MTKVDELIRQRASAAGLAIDDGLVAGLTHYLEVLAFWNRKVNLTAFDLTDPTDEAIDRLVIEAVAAAPLLGRDDRTAIDIGSGGGSPAIPLLLAAPWLEMKLVEVRVRKAAFLREAIRALGVSASVANCRMEDLTYASHSTPVDVVTFRAVKADRMLWDFVDRVLIPEGHALWFGGGLPDERFRIARIDRAVVYLLRR